MEKSHPSQEWRRMVIIDTDLSGSAGELGIKGWSVLCACSSLSALFLLGKISGEASGVSRPRLQVLDGLKGKHGRGSASGAVVHGVVAL